MKKYLQMLPLAFYPYAYLIYMAVIALTNNFLLPYLPHLAKEYADYFYFAIAILFQFFMLGLAIYGAVSTARDGCTAAEAAQINLFVKTVQIPAYLLHFFMGLIGRMLSIMGIALFIVAVVVDYATIFLTGINAIGCAVKMSKQKILPTALAVLMGIGSFIFYIDYIIAVLYVIVAKIQPPLKKNQ